MKGKVTRSVEKGEMLDTEFLEAELTMKQIKDWKKRATNADE